MPLENMKAMLSKAAAGGYAVGAFNVLDYNSTKAVVQAAEELQAPVIIQTSAKTVTFWGSGTLMDWMRQLCASARVPSGSTLRPSRSRRTCL
jgi:fructose/tagatose bisphosphate aldolase